LLSVALFLIIQYSVFYLILGLTLQIRQGLPTHRIRQNFTSMKLKQGSIILDLFHKLYLSLWVDFIDILHMHFAPIFWCQKLQSCMCFGFEIFWRKNIGKKGACKMLMKLTLWQLKKSSRQSRPTPTIFFDETISDFWSNELQFQTKEFWIRCYKTNIIVYFSVIARF